jgi:invasion protein IalB
VVSVAPEVGGVRVVVASGQRVDLRWVVPAEVPASQPLPSASATPDPAAWTVECHIPGHLAKGMWIPIRWVVETPS